VSAAALALKTLSKERREMVEHRFGTIKARKGATHFLMKRLKNVRTEMALSVLAYNLTLGHEHHRYPPADSSDGGQRSAWFPCALRG